MGYLRCKIENCVDFCVMSPDLAPPDGAFADLTPNPDDAIEQLRERLAATLTDARAALADLEDDNRRIRGELQLVMASRGWRTLSAAQHRAGRAVALACHPWWTLRTLVRHATHRGPAA